MPPAPPSGETQEAPEVLPEQVVGETTPLPLQALPTPENGAQTRKGEPAEAEVPSEIKDSSLPPQPAGIPAHRVLGPPTSIPPKPPGPVTMDSESEEMLAADQRTVQPNGLLGEEHVREVATDGLLQGNSRRLSLTPDPEKGEPPALDPESQGGEAQPPECKQAEDVSSSGPRETLLDTELASAAAGTSLRHNQDSQHCSLSGDEEDELFKGATLKVPRPTAQPEEEDEDEVSMKGRPPPTPLFGDDDDDDDDDIGWLG